jgi:hypothetical protein
LWLKKIAKSSVALQKSLMNTVVKVSSKQKNSLKADFIINLHFIIFLLKYDIIFTLCDYLNVDDEYLGQVLDISTLSCFLG